MISFDKHKPEWVSLLDVNFDDKTFQYRNDISDQDVTELAESLQNEGQRFPVILWQRETGEPKIICGFRRTTAARKLRWEKILAITVSEDVLPYEDAVKLSLLENVQRKSLTDLDKVFTCKRLSEEGKSNVKIGEMLGVNEKTVRRYLKIVNAPADIQDQLKSGKLSISAVDRMLEAETARQGAEVASKNKNMYVKTIKNGMDISIKFRKNRDNPDEVIEFLSNMIKEIRKAAKQKKKAVGV